MLTNDYQYKELLIAIKEQIRSSQAKAALAVNSAVIQLYWKIGEMIANNQGLFDGRNNYIEQLASDIKQEFPSMPGFSRRNLFDIRRFYLFYSSVSVRQLAALSTTDYQSISPAQQLAAIDNQSISVRQAAALSTTDYQSISPVQQVVARVPWGHHLLILNKIKDPEQALFYIQLTIEHNWSRAILTLQIEQDLFSRQGKAFNNFKNTLPEPQALIAQQQDCILTRYRQYCPPVHVSDRNTY